MPDACLWLSFLLVFASGNAVGVWWVRRYVLRLPLMKRLGIAWLILRGAEQKMSIIGRRD